MTDSTTPGPKAVTRVRRIQGLLLAAALLALVSAISCLTAMSAHDHSLKYAFGIGLVLIGFVGLGIWNILLHGKGTRFRDRFSIAPAVQVGPAFTPASLLILLGAVLIGLLAAPSVTDWLDSRTGHHSWLAAAVISAVIAGASAFATWASDDEKRAVEQRAEGLAAEVKELRQHN